MCDYTDLDRNANFEEAVFHQNYGGNRGKRVNHENSGNNGNEGVNGGVDRRLIGYKGCHPVVNPEHESPNLEFVWTETFDAYRAARLAPMTELKGTKMSQ